MQSNQIDHEIYSSILQRLSLGTFYCILVLSS